jgi:cytidine deaminase
LCAERTAVAAAFSKGLRKFNAIAVVAPSSPLSAPCGTCRQVLSEFAPDLPIISSNTEGEVEETTLLAIFPKQFDAISLKSGIGR